MSGGAFDYLYSKRGIELVEAEDSVNAILNVLVNEFPEAYIALKVTRDISDRIHDIQLKMDALNELVEQMSPAWKAIEWWYSNDIDKKSASKEVT